MKNVLLAGVTGYLGEYVAKELKKRGYFLTVVVRNKNKLIQKNIIADKVLEGDMTDENFYRGVMQNIDIVISTIGITRQKDGKTYMDVDYGINHLLLQEALREQVDKFMYVSVLHGEKLQHLKICEAKERFVKELQSSDIDSLIIRPTGFFSDMDEFMAMAKSGRVFLFGDGKKKVNPISGEDLSRLMVSAIELQKDAIKIGGPEILTHNEIAQLAFKSTHKEEKIIYIPKWIQQTLLFLLKMFTTEKTYGPVEFFLSVMNMDMTCNQFGSITLREHFEAYAKKMYSK